ncbi:hypothetical protein AAE028_33910 [Sinorhizobium sp. CB9]
MTSLPKKQTGLFQCCFERLSRIIGRQLSVENPKADFQRGLVRLAVGVASPLLHEPQRNVSGVADVPPFSGFSSGLEGQRVEGLTVFHGGDSSTVSQ